MGDGLAAGDDVVTGTGEAGGTERALGRGAPTASASCPPSVTTSTIATTATTNRPAAAAATAPERKLISSMRA